MFRIVFVGDPHFLTILCCGVIGARTLVVFSTSLALAMGMRSREGFGAAVHFQGSQFRVLRV